MNLCTYLILFVGMVLTTNVSGQKPRRDESYPPPEYLARFTTIHDVCRERTGATEESIKEFSDGDGISDDPALKCYMNCLFHAINVVDDDGDMHFEKLQGYVPGDLAEILGPMLTGCYHPQGETQCDRAWWFHQCWKKNDPVHYFLP